MNNLAYQDDDILKERIELIDGKVFMISPHPKYEHITICGNINEIKVSVCDNLVVKLKDIFERVDNI